MAPAHFRVVPAGLAPRAFGPERLVGPAVPKTARLPPEHATEPREQPVRRRASLSPPSPRWTPWGSDRAGRAYRQTLAALLGRPGADGPRGPLQARSSLRRYITSDAAAARKRSSRPCTPRSRSHQRRGTRRQRCGCWVRRWIRSGSCGRWQRRATGNSSTPCTVRRCCRACCGRHRRVQQLVWAGPARRAVSIRWIRDRRAASVGHIC